MLDENSSRCKYKLSSYERCRSISQYPHLHSCRCASSTEIHKSSNTQCKYDKYRCCCSSPIHVAPRGGAVFKSEVSAYLPWISETYKSNNVPLTCKLSLLSCLSFIGTASFLSSVYDFLDEQGSKVGLFRLHSPRSAFNAQIQIMQMMGMFSLAPG